MVEMWVLSLAAVTVVEWAVQLAACSEQMLVERKVASVHSMVVRMEYKTVD